SNLLPICVFFFFSSRRRHTRFSRDWSSDVCSPISLRFQLAVLLSLRRARAAPGREQGPRDGLVRQQRQESGESGSEEKRALGTRSEERRVGKECRSGWSARQYNKIRNKKLCEASQ